MEAKVQKWENSFGIIIPKELLESFGLKTNDKVDVRLEDGAIIISKLKKNHLTIEDRFEKYNKVSLEEKVEDYYWGKDIGIEKIKIY